MSLQRWLTLLVPLGLLGLIAAEPAPPAETDIFQEYVSEFALLTPGTGKFPASFQMGTRDGPPAERPVVKVTFKQPFAIARYEVTQQMYQAVMGKNPARWQGLHHSVEKVDWNEANEFCKKITDILHKRKLIKADQIVRLPSEAEWEYACRAGTTTRFYFGDSADDLGAYAWYAKNSKGEDPPGGIKKANAWGLFDMSGYVSEWCADAWHPDHTGASPEGKARGNDKEKRRVIRGGSFADPADMCRSAARDHKPLTFGSSDRIGFRCVLVKTSAKE